MLSTQAHAKSDTIGLVDDDDVDLIRAIEASFGVRFGDETTRWFTVGDIYNALLARVPSDGTAGLCSTSMAFYRLRVILARKEGIPGYIRPGTKLAGIVSLPPKRLFATISQELDIGALPNTLSLRGGVGVLVLLIGFSGIFFTLSHHVLWPLLLLMPLGFAMTSTDMGAYRSTSVGDLARRIAARHFSRFASVGADTRPTAVWRALCDLIADQTGFDPKRITPDTRLIA